MCVILFLFAAHWLRERKGKLEMKLNTATCKALRLKRGSEHICFFRLSLKLELDLVSNL